MALAATLAFSIAAMLDVQNAYWAAMPVWVVAQSSRGLLLERGFFRILGTLAGAGFGFALLAFTRDPVVLLTALAVWVGLMAGLVHLVAGVKSYGVMLAGMTTAVVLLPSLHAGEHLLPLAIARVECTLIGVLVVTLVTGWSTPMADRRAFYLRIRRMAADACGFAAQASAGRAGTAALEQQVLREIVDIEALARTMAAGSLEGYRRLRHTTALAAAGLSLMTCAQALGARRARGEAVDASLPDKLRAQATALAAPRHSPNSPWLPESGDAAEARLHSAMRHIVLAENALFDDRPAAGELPAPAPQRDWQRARKRGLIAGLATYAASMSGLLSGWSAGELMALGVCIFSMVLGSLPTPRAVAPKLLLGVLVGVAAAVFYRFVLQPHVSGTATLIASVLPFIVVGAWARVHPRTAMPALDSNMCFMLGSQAGMPAAGAAQILGGSAALALAAVLVAFCLLVAPENGGARLRLLAAGLRDGLGQHKATTTRRALQLLMNLQRANPGAPLPPGLPSALGLGDALADLRKLRPAAASALRVLADFATDPARAAHRARQVAGQTPDPAVALALRDAADALLAGAAWLKDGSPG